MRPDSTVSPRPGRRPPARALLFLPRVCPGCGRTFTPYGRGKPQLTCSRECRYAAVRRPHAERFWAHVDRSGGPDACWPWMGGTTRGGYGIFERAEGDRSQTTAHRVAWFLKHGAYPVEQVCHDCPGGDNPVCTNDRHLFLGTQAENIADRDRKGRGGHVLTAAQVDAIRAIGDARPRPTQQTVAARFGCDQTTISRIWSGTGWAGYVSPPRS